MSARSAKRAHRLGLVLLALVAGLLLGRAALAYYRNVSICLIPPHIVGPSERIEKVVRHYRAHPNVQHPGLGAMDPRDCCTVARNLPVEERVTFWSTLSGRQSQIVGTDVRGPAGNLLNVPTDTCGEVVVRED
ncbi:hypothetical protein E2493_14615 [Sphingomonas parva]|uniref:Uncharacterized protein n=1 Tax=Sphingomonas parva TaxID=2555898 RepID=A0A4Y8ZNB1_9SPHN|nr:hypothetical protein [Sphingomonas parva]TFI57444.1 hypothetical protein E2493_14615 [Sphingomonas parva]